MDTKEYYKEAHRIAALVLTLQRMLGARASADELTNFLGILNEELFQTRPGCHIAFVVDLAQRELGGPPIGLALFLPSALTFGRSFDLGNSQILMLADMAVVTHPIDKYVVVKKNRYGRTGDFNSLKEIDFGDDTRCVFTTRLT
jgi:hypothetical protein